MKNIYAIYETPDIITYKDCHIVSKKVLKNRIGNFFPFIDLLEDKKLLPNDSSSIVISFNLANPLFDEEALKDSLNNLDLLNESNKIVQSGLVGGTSVSFICKTSLLKKNDELKPLDIFYESQEEYSAQLNLYKIKRQKVFKYLIDKYPEITTWPIRKFLDWCSTDDGVKEILSYGEDIELIEHKQCPYCGSVNKKPLYHESLHPAVGFLTKSSNYYDQCKDCNLVYLKYVFNSDELYKIYDEYETEIGVRETNIEEITVQNTSHYENYTALFDYITKEGLEIGKILDIGCGRCQFVCLAREEFPNSYIKGIDYDIPSQFNDLLQSKNIDFINSNFINELKYEKKKYDLITLWEVIEHIPVDLLSEFITGIKGLLSNKGILVISTPDMDDEYSKMFDFWAAFPIHHLTVFSRKWLEPFFEKNGMCIEDEFHEAVALKESSGWPKYASEFAKTQTDKAFYKIFEDVVDDKNLNSLFNKVRRHKNKGSEIVLVIRKR